MIELEEDIEHASLPTNVIMYPFDVNYSIMSKAIITHGPEKMKSEIVRDGWCESVAIVIIRKALRGGWGS